MADKQEIELFISEEGELKLHIKGIPGPACLKTLDDLVNAVGREKERKLTNEYYQAETKQNNLNRQKIK
jgi:hypothetical protein